jgi:hypothetical protein
MATLTVPEDDALIQYVALAGQTDFTYDFPIFDDSDLVVTREDADTGAVTTLTLGSDYTVTGAGSTSGGSITLTSGATEDDVYTIYRDVPNERTTDFQTAGDFFAETVNDELDRIVMMIQQLNTVDQRSLRAPLFDQGGSIGLLPTLSERKDKLLAFDATTGDPIARDVADVSTAIDTAITGLSDGDYLRYDGTNSDWRNSKDADKLRVVASNGATARSLARRAADRRVATVADLQALTFADYDAGDVVFLRGRNTDDDAAHGFFIKDTTDYSTSTGNGVLANDEVTASEGDGGVHVAPASDKTGASGVWRRLLEAPTFVNVRWWGAVDDDTGDQQAAFQTAIDYLSNVHGEGTIFIPAVTGTRYRTETLIRLKSNIRLVGDGRALIANFGSTFGDNFIFAPGWLHEAGWDGQTFYLVKDISSGDRRVELRTASEESNFSSGDVVYVYEGYPKNSPETNNALFAEMRRVDLIDTANGFIEFDFAIEEGHSEPSAASWDSGTTYSKGDIVAYNGRKYKSLQDSNLDNEPPAADTAPYYDDWWVQYITALTFLDSVTINGYQTFIADRSEIHNLRLFCNESAWIQRAACYEGNFSNLYIERADAFLSANGLGRCRFSSIWVSFYEHFCELAEGCHHTVLESIHGDCTRQNTSGNILIDVKRKCTLRDFDIYTNSNLQWTDLISIKNSEGTVNTIVENGRISARASNKIIGPTGPNFIVRNVDVNLLGGTCNRFYRSEGGAAGFEAVSNAWVENVTVSNGVLSNHLIQTKDEDENFINCRFDLLAGSTEKIDLQGNNGRVDLGDQTADLLEISGDYNTINGYVPAGITFSDSGTGNTVNNVGEESANAENPTEADYKIGDIVNFTDTGDGSGTGVYVRFASGWQLLA